MNKNEEKKGISLIVLVITIIVIIILAVAVILSIANNNPIENAKKARFLNDLKTIQEEINLYNSKAYADAKSNGTEYVPAKIEDIKSAEKYKGKIDIRNDNVVLKKEATVEEKKWALENNINILISDEYQEVEYIESTGTQWINTGFCPTTKTKAEIDIELTKLEGGAYKFIMGSRNTTYNTNGYMWEVIINPNKLLHVQVGDYTTNRIIQKEYTVIPGTRMKISFDPSQKQLFVNYEVIEYFNGEVGDKKVDYPMYLLTTIYGDQVNMASTKMYAISAKLYSTTIYDDDKLVRDFVPCYRKSDGVIGLYDRVENKFYTNSGTGSFQKGEDINNI